MNNPENSTVSLYLEVGATLGMMKPKEGKYRFLNKRGNSRWVYSRRALRGTVRDVETLEVTVRLLTGRCRYTTRVFADVGKQLSVLYSPFL